MGLEVFFPWREMKFIFFFFFVRGLRGMREKSLQPRFYWYAMPVYWCSVISELARLPVLEMSL